MTLRPPRSNSRPSHVAALDYEIAQEQASALGRLGRALERAPAALADQGRAQTPGGGARARGVAGVGCFFVQGEGCGLREPRPVMRDYRVPLEVQNRMGCFGGR